MSIFGGPAEHAANPPASWRVVKRAPRRWALTLVDGGPVLDTFATRREAEAAKVDGWLVALYAKETRWYAGEPVAGWKPYADLATRPSTTDTEVPA